MDILGIDIGGSGIKGAPVNLERGELTQPRHRIVTPEPATPDAVADVIGALAHHFDWRGPIGCTFPAVVQRGIVWSAANVDKSWIGVDGQVLFHRTTGCPLVLLNDADAAGLAEMEFGAGQGQSGVVMMLTFGTGIGSALFINGQLVPNTELGHLEVRGKDAETRAAARVRDEKGLDWKQWSKRINEYLGMIEKLFSPDLIIFGGGVSKEHGKFFQYLESRAPVVPAVLFNEAGIVGAALAARSLASEQAVALHQ
ncbi:MAG: ROK family protein [Anaerolineae bacterium]|nr:ROK family protein [Anaerolineae bacterium]